MPRFDISFEELAPDFRDREIPLKLTGRNAGTLPVEILAVSPRIPEGVTLLETRDSSLLAAKAKHTEVCEQLNNLAKDVMFATDEALRNRVIKLQVDAAQKTFAELSGWLGIFKLYYKAFSGRYLQHMKQAKEKEQALTLRIENSSDAKRVFEDVMDQPAIDSSLKKAFLFKTEKLANLEGQIGHGKDLEAAPIATVEPDSVFATTYVVRFPRKWANTSNFTISVEVSFREQGKPERHNSIITDSVRISPSPLVLTSIAMASALLGVALKHVFPIPGSELKMIPWSAIFPQSELIAALILAMIFFNVFEFTDLLKGVGKNLGWRSAMLIGVLCGLGSDRIFAAFKSLIGA